MPGRLAGSKGGVFVAFQLLVDKKTEHKRNELNLKVKELDLISVKEKIKNSDKEKLEQRIENLEKTVLFLLERM